MSDNTKIEWADATLNYVNGCTVHSPGCTNCYAMKQAHRFPLRQGLTVKTKGGMVWTGEVRRNEKALEQSLSWKRGRRIFWNAHGDLFHKDVPDEWIDRQFGVMALTPHHTHMVLTKRAARMRAYLADEERPGRIIDAALYIKALPDNWSWPLRNVWLGVSVEDQARADERIPELLATPAAVRFLSCEPLLGEIDLTSIDLPGGWHEVFPLGQEYLGRPSVDDDGKPTTRIDWVIAGGESGPGARPMHPDWARSLRDQCAAAGVPFFHKQNGEFAPGEIAGEYLDPEKPAKGLSYFNGQWDECWSYPDGHCDDEPDVYRIGKKRAGRLLDGVEHDGMPA